MSRNNRRSRKSADPVGRPPRHLEALETRCLLASSLNAGLLDIAGDNQANVIDVTLNTGTNRIEVLIDGLNTDPANPTGYDPNDVQTIRIRGLRGNDTISVDNALTLPATITGEQGNDLISGGGGDEFIDGGQGNDSVSGGDGADTIVGGAGADSLEGANGADSILGGAGNDILVGGDNEDTIHGGAGNDSIAGGDGADSIIGFAGRDSLFGEAGDDTIDGGAGNDSIDGGADDDIIFGGAGLDTISGADGDDLLLGGNGNDQLTGGLGSDILAGEGGNDSLDGGDDEDALQSGKGRDTLTGGAGIDLFGPTVRGGVRADFLVGTELDAAASVTPGLFTDSGLLGTRTDLLPGAPDVNDRSHQDGDIDYSLFSNPPTYGPHHGFDPNGTDSNPGVTPRRTGFYTSEQPDEDLVHNLEHGHVWISFDPVLLNAADQARLKALFDVFGGGRGIIVTPRPDNDDAIALVSWAHLQTLAGFDLASIREFIFTNRGHAPEGFITP
jgi:hypothetical protein